MDREAWRAAIYAVAKSQTRLSDWTELLTVEHRAENIPSHGRKGHTWPCAISVSLELSLQPQTTRPRWIPLGQGFPPPAQWKTSHPHLGARWPHLARVHQECTKRDPECTKLKLLPRAHSSRTKVSTRVCPATKLALHGIININLASIKWLGRQYPLVFSQSWELHCTKIISKPLFLCSSNCSRKCQKAESPPRINTKKIGNFPLEKLIWKKDFMTINFNIMSAMDKVEVL